MNQIGFKNAETKMAKLCSYTCLSIIDSTKEYNFIEHLHIELIRSNISVM